MLFEGGSLSLEQGGDGILYLTFDLQNSSVNKFDANTVEELERAIDIVETSGARGLLVRSAKPAFIVGADITEFVRLFKLEEEAFFNIIHSTHRLFARIEDLSIPTVVAINGMAFGGGFELCLACDFRVVAESAVVGLPEIKLGLFPGWGGTIRLPRLTGLETAVDWIESGRPQSAERALASGAVDRVVSDAELEEEAAKLIEAVHNEEIRLDALRNKKREAIDMTEADLHSVIEARRAKQDPLTNARYPAFGIALDVLREEQTMHRDEAMAVEARGFVKVAKTDTAESLVGLFLNEQSLKRSLSGFRGSASEIGQLGVLGAGIMGGGIAYQSALKGLSVVMKDITDEALQIGMNEAGKRLDSLVKRGRLSEEKKLGVINAITPTLDMQPLADSDLTIEAVVENPQVKAAVLAELESIVQPGAVIASNTSTISIDDLAVSLQDSSRFVGIHFFNPVHVMPLVEVIRGKNTSETTVATAVEYVRRIGKNPIVVNNCPGFLVNRVLFPYLNAFDALVRDGIDYRQIDAVMTAFGWPMGPAYLLDVVGIDTAVHANGIMAKGFPDRMQQDYETATRRMFERGRLGQKSGSGFYRYQPDERGRPQQLDDTDAIQIAYDEAANFTGLDEESIVLRMMIPLCIELARCVEEGIVDSPAAADMGLIWGLGFPAHVGGGLRYMDRMGMKSFCDRADRFVELGAAYEPTEGMKSMAADGRTWFGGEE